MVKNISVVAIALAAIVLVPCVARAEDAPAPSQDAPPALHHPPRLTAHVGDDLPVGATVDRPDKMRRAILVYRSGPAWGEIDFQRSSDEKLPYVAVIPASPAKPVVGTLPPLHRSTSTTAPAVPATPAAAPGPTTLLPPAPAPATAPPPTQNLNEPGTASVQAGSFSTAAAAQQALSSLNRKGFGGFAIVGTAAPFRVVRGGMSQNSARALVRALSARGVDAFSRG